ncbi:M61 family peptidase [Acidithiobacillus sp.]|uniref:M61 family metallopeptidase n=1 Tax=Acidithiobacillus sp. TaxID=1872118 RepID=UPI0025BFFDD0|nr:M61 family peptidase [Acidithiobacillus sp.]
MALAAVADAAPAGLVYRVHADPLTHRFIVDLHIPATDAQEQILAMPVWVPGSYTRRDLARHIVEIHAADDAGALSLRKIDDHRWILHPRGMPLRVHYTVYALDLSVRTAYLDERLGFFNGPALFLRVHGHEQGEHRLELSGPDAWQVATAMPRVGGSDCSWGSFAAADHRRFCNHPVLMGALSFVHFAAAGLPHRLVLAGHEQANLPALGRDLATLCTWQQEFWGSSPFPEYHFLCMGSENGYGGLEHERSSALLCARDDLTEADRAGWERFLGLASHEYFHSWWVQAFHPAALRESVGEEAVLTRDLWVFEGITSYYDDLALRRSGLLSVEAYLEGLGRNITTLTMRPGQGLQNLWESSEDAWIKLYHPHPNSANFEVSYYNKGALLALCLDLLLRDRGENYSLDAFLQHLWHETGGEGAALPEGEFLPRLAAWAGPDVAATVDAWLAARGPLPLSERLASVGLELRLRRPSNPSDKGGKPAEPPLRCWLGAQWHSHAQGVELGWVATGGAAEKAGLCPGDRIVALDRCACSAETLQGRLDAMAPGLPRTLHYFRDGRLWETSLVPQEPPTDRAFLHWRAEVDPETRRRRARWLGLDPDQAADSPVSGG